MNLKINGFLDVEYSESLLENILLKLDENKEIRFFDHNEVSLITKEVSCYLTEELPFINDIGSIVVVFHEQDVDIGAIKIGTPLCKFNIKNLIELSEFTSTGTLIVTSIDGKQGICIWCSEYDTSFYKWS